MVKIFLCLRLQCHFSIHEQHTNTVHLTRPYDDMGIPKLMQDLMPYAEDVVLGRSTAQPEPHRLTWPVVNKVVIDGPSLVYYVYSRLYPRIASSVVSIDAQPSDTEMSLGVWEFLAALTSRQIEVSDSRNPILTYLLADNDRTAIYFDGALPLGKRATRLERLEKTRVMLENLGKQHPGPFTSPPSIPSATSKSALKSSIWNKKVLASSRRHPRLPPPSFLVACVLDDLRGDPMGKYPVHVVPGEADSYCAAVAKGTGAAILSNDSDMTMYDLGSEGSLVLLDSLELMSNIGSDPDDMCQSETLIGQRLHPVNIARRLNLIKPTAKPSLLRYGFQRACDSSAPDGTIRSRCTSPLSAEAGKAFQQFCEAYEDSENVESMRDAAVNLFQLDPRLSELYCQYNCAGYLVKPSHSPHSYLPVMFEDPTRASSWKYGTDTRVVAYSLLKLSAEVASNTRYHDFVTEFQRRGARISGLPLNLLNRVTLKSSMDTIIEDLPKHFSSGNALLQWRIFALEKVRKEKERIGKPTIPLVWATQFFGKSYNDYKLSWDDIQTYANSQAVLYSLWLLKQACAVSKPPKDLQATMDSLGLTLQSLGPLKRLMASRWEVADDCRDRASVVPAEACESADWQDTPAKQNSMSSPMATDEGDEPQSATSKVGLVAKDQRRRVNGNIFELLDPS